MQIDKYLVNGIVHADMCVRIIHDVFKYYMSYSILNVHMHFHEYLMFR